MTWGNGRKSYGGGQSSSSTGSASSGRFQKRNSGGGNFKGRSGSGNTGKQSENEWRPITGLFPSRSGNAHTVFVTDEILECLQAIKLGDMLCVKPRQDSDMLNFSVMLAEGEQQEKQDS